MCSGFNILFCHRLIVDHRVIKSSELLLNYQCIQNINRMVAVATFASQIL